MGTNLTDEQLDLAVQLRFAERKYWEQIASKLDVTPKTLYNARQTDRWAAAAGRFVQAIKAEALPVAWQGLLDAARLKDVTACREILNRLDEVIEQTLNVKHSGEVDHKISEEEYAELLEGLAGISTNGASRDRGSETET